MKNILLILMFVISTKPLAFAQLNILADRKMDIASTPYTLPLTLKADKSFSGKTIGFYSTKNDTKKIVEAKFDSGDLSHLEDGSFQIIIDEQGKIDIGNGTSISGESFFLRIDEGPYNGPVKILKKVKAKDPQTTKTDTGTTGSQVVNAPVSLSAIVDAIYLNGHNDGIHLTELRLMLANYNIKDEADLKANKFLYDVLPHDVLFKKALSTIDQGHVEGGEDMFSSIGSLDVTTIADGLAKFLVKRTKEELSITFFQKFKEDLRNYKDLQTLFPATYNLLQAIDQQIYNYSNYIGNLREAFRTDLNSLDDHLPGIIDNHQDIFSQSGNFEMGAALRTACYVAKSVRHEMHPGDILDGFPVSYLTDGAPESDKAALMKLSGSIQLLQLISESLHNNTSYWVEVQTIRQCVGDKQTLELYFGLLLQLAHNKYHDVSFGGATTFYNSFNTDDAVAGFSTDYPLYRQYVLTMGNRVNELNKLTKELPAGTSDSVKVERFVVYVKAYSSFLRTCVESSQLPLLNKIAGFSDLERNTEKYFDIIDETTGLVTSINRKQYSEAVNHLIAIYNLAVKTPIFNTKLDPSKVDKLSTSVKNELVTALVTTAKSTPDQSASNVLATVPAFADAMSDFTIETKKADATLVLLARYGAFMASIVAAKSSDDVSAAIEAVALPVGSATIKKHSLFNVSLNAYVGVYGGYEQIKDVDFGQKQISFKNWNSYGITAPVGVAFSTSIGRRWKNPPSVSGMISIIDIGALVAYRFDSKNDSVAVVPKVQLQNIISPGLLFAFGLPNIPVSVNLGYQLGPVLRTVKSKENTISGNYSRFSISLCVDIPLLNLYTKTKGKK